MYTLTLLNSLMKSKYYSDEWLNGGPSRRFPPHMDRDIEEGRKEALIRIYPDRVTLEEVEQGFDGFSTSTGIFEGYYVFRERGIKKPYAWWATHGEACTIL